MLIKMTIDATLLNGEVMRNANVTPSGTPADRNPTNNGMEEQEQNGVITPNREASR
jgi:hypothetical protein